MSLCDVLAAWIDMVAVYSIQKFQWVYIGVRQILLDYIIRTIHAIDVLLYEMIEKVSTASQETKKTLTTIIHIVQKQLYLLSTKSAWIVRELGWKFDETSQLCMNLLIRL